MTNAEKLKAHQEHARRFKRARRSEKLLTPKQRVLRKFPNAWAHQWKDCWTIYDGGGAIAPPFRGQDILGEARSVVGAWKLAAQRIAL